MGHLCDRHNIFDGDAKGCPSCAGIEKLLLQQWDVLNTARCYLRVRIDNLQELAKTLQQQELAIKKALQKNARGGK